MVVVVVVVGVLLVEGVPPDPEPSPLPELPPELEDEVAPPPSPLAAGEVNVDGDIVGAVPPEAKAICLGLSCLGLSLTSVPWTAPVTCGGALPPVLTDGGEGGPPPGGVTEKFPGGTGTVCPPAEKSTWPCVPTLTTPLTPLTWNTMK